MTSLLATSRHDRITISTIHVAFALSLVLHIFALWNWRDRLRLEPFDDHGRDKSGGTLAVRLAPIPAPPIDQQAAPAQRLTMPRADQRPAQAPGPAAPRAAAAQPRVLALNQPARSSVSAPTAVPQPSSAPPASSATLGQDFAAFVASRQRAREAVAGPPEPPLESEQDRINREAAVNLGFARTPTFGSNKNIGGGTFQVRKVTLDRAEFAFFGWNKFIQRNSLQSIEVERGSNPSIELAVVRKMISIIREQASGDFVWVSLRLQHDVTLSARPGDNGALEEFLMKEFFAEVARR